MTMNEAPPTPPRTGLLMKHCKFLWRFFLLSNFAIGAFLFAKARPRDSIEIHRKTSHKLHKGKTDAEVSLEPPATSSTELNYDDFIVPVAMPVQAQAPIPEEQQREIFKWMLEEKRKAKPKDAMGKKQIDEEKAILKHFLRAQSIPKY